jgi:hypothetical protein
MSVPTIIRIFDGPGGVMQFFLESPDLPEATRGHRWAIDLSTTPYAELLEGRPIQDLVHQVGERLHVALARHPAVQNALAAARVAGRPIFLQCDSPRAEAVPWETLRDAMTWYYPPSPIARLRRPRVDVRREYVFEPPLRVMAILSAAGGQQATAVPADGEWGALEASLLGARAAGLPVEMRVLVGEGNLLTAIEQAGHPGVSAGRIVDARRVLDDIAEFRPNLLHFFCHGAADDVPHLQLGTSADWLAGQDGSVRLTADELGQWADPNRTVWLVTLNCCFTAALPKAGRSLASDLVGAGFPAAIGMREAIASTQANLVSCYLYESIVAKLGALQASGSQVDWVDVLVRARDVLLRAGGRETSVGQIGSEPPALAGQAAVGRRARRAAGARVGATAAHSVACNSRDWTLPVLYLRPEPFRLVRKALPTPAPAAGTPQPGAGLQARIQALEEWRTLRQERERIAALSDVPPDVREAILTDLDEQIAVLDAQLRVPGGGPRP